MGAPAAGDVYELVFHISGSDDANLQFTSFWQQQSAGIGTDPFTVANALAAALAPAVGPSIVNMLSQDLIANAVTCRRQNNGGGPTAVMIYNETGDVSERFGSISTAVNVALIPEVAPYREGHMYLAGFAQSSIADDVIDSALVTLVTAIQTAFGGSYTALGSAFVQVIYDRKTKIARSIVGTVLRQLITPLKRRLKRRGDKKPAP